MPDARPAPRTISPPSIRIAPPDAPAPGRTASPMVIGALYLLPFALGSGLAVVFGYLAQTRHALGMIQQEIAEPTKPHHLDSDLLSRVDRIRESVSVAEIDRVIRSASTSNAIAILALSILPPLIMAVGAARGLASTGGKIPDAAPQWAAVRESIFMKIMIGVSLACGWIYWINPYGIAASTVRSFADVFLVSDRNYPLAFAPDSPLLALRLAFLGWYVHMMSYFLYRAYRNDVYATRAYAHLFRKLLLTGGVALLLSKDTLGETASAATAMMIGLFPIGAVQILKRLSQRKMETMDGASDALGSIPGISLSAIYRLEEEGIDSVSDLAIASPAKLARTLPYDEITIANWVGAALLISVIGSDKYRALKPYCLTADGFIRRAQSRSFRAVLERACGIANPGEICRLLGVVDAVDHDDELTVLPPVVPSVTVPAASPASTEKPVSKPSAPALSETMISAGPIIAEPSKD